MSSSHAASSIRAFVRFRRSRRVITFTAFGLLHRVTLMQSSRLGLQKHTLLASNATSKPKVQPTDEANDPRTAQIQRVCHDTLPPLARVPALRAGKGRCWGARELSHACGDCGAALPSMHDALNQRQVVRAHLHRGNEFAGSFICPNYPQICNYGF